MKSVARAGLLVLLSYEAVTLELSAQAPPASDTSPPAVQYVAGEPYVFVEQGKFIMGCSPDDEECSDTEKPRHSVKITRGFWLGKTPVTVGGYRRFTSATGAKAPLPLPFDQSDEHPVVNVSWEDAVAYCKWVGGRLPTEAEYEYAARGGSDLTRYGSLDEISWYADNSGQARIDSTAMFEDTGSDGLEYLRVLLGNGNRTHPVGKKQPNKFGLFDMLGNVTEWCSDWFGDDYYRTSPEENPSGPEAGNERVVRGGSWAYSPKDVRASFRDFNRPGGRDGFLGFRCVLETSNEKHSQPQQPQRGDYLRGIEAYLREDFATAIPAFANCINQDDTKVRCLEFLGHSTFEIRRYNEAIAAYRGALEADRQAHILSQDELRIVIDNMGVSYGMSQQLVAARDWFARAVRDDPEFPFFYYNLACAFAELGDLNSAVNNLRQAWHRRKNLVDGEALPDPRVDNSFSGIRDEPQFRSLMAEFFGKPPANKEEAKRQIADLLSKPVNGGVEDQVDMLNEVRALANAAGLWEEEMFALGLIARLYSTIPNYPEALNYYQEALAAARSHHLEGESTLLISIGSLYQQLGNSAKAKASFDEAEHLARTNSDPGLMIDVLNAKAVLAGQTDHYSQGLRFLSEALPLAEKSHDNERVAWIRNDMGGIYSEIGNFPLALENYTAAVTLASGELTKLGTKPQSDEANWTAIQLKNIAGSALNNIGMIRSEQKDYKGGLEAYQQAEALIPYILEPYLPGRIVNGIAVAYAMLGHDEEAIATYKRALQLKRSNGDVLGQAVTLSNLAAMADRRRDYPEAERLLKEALEIAERTGSITEEARIHDDLGVIYEHQGLQRDALAAYERSIHFREQIRSNTLTPALRTTQALFSEDAYQHAVLLQLKLGNKEAAFDTSERARARSFLDQVGTGEVAAGPVDPALSARERLLRIQLASADENIRSASKADRQLALAADRDAKEQEYEDLLNRIRVQSPEYASAIGAQPLKLAEVRRLVPPGTVLVSYFVTPGSTIAFIVDADNGLRVKPLAVGEEDLRRAASEFYPFASPDLVPKALNTLYEWLLEPVLGGVRAETLLIAPHGVLHLVPFAALRNARGVFLCDQYSLVELPSASALQLFGRGRETATEAIAALSFSHPDGASQLHYADEEVRKAAARFHATPTLDATVKDFRAKARGARIIHIAAHGEFNLGHPEFSRIILRPDNTADGSLEVKDIYGLNLKATDLVVLSACETGKAAVSAGDETVALNRAFLVAGANSVLATLWLVDDEATSILMDSFYENLAKGDNRATALKKARAALRSAQNHRYTHPYFWSGFVLTGDPGRGSE